jgi:hypothetical protein
MQSYVSEIDEKLSDLAMSKFGMSKIKEKQMSKDSGLNEGQIKLLTETVQKNGWASADQFIQFETWTNFSQTPNLLRNYLCKDGSGFIRGYYDEVGIFYIKRFHLRDEEWTDA